MTDEIKEPAVVISFEIGATKGVVGVKVRVTSDLFTGYEWTGGLGGIADAVRAAALVQFQLANAAVNPQVEEPNVED